MTKKDYVLIAEALIDGYKTCHVGHVNNRDSTFDVIVSYLSRWLMADNPRFEPKKFLMYINNRIPGGRK